MAGFRNYSLTKGGALTLPSIHSPNFQQSPLTGWSIDKDGNAYFESVTIGGGVVRVTFAASAPASPNTGDVWFNLSAGAQPNVWSGSAWTAYQWGTTSIASGAVTSPLIASGAVGTAELAAGAVTTAQIAAAAGILGSQIASGTVTGSNIAAGTVTAGLLAAGIVVAGIVDGTNIEGAYFIAGTGGGSAWQTAAPSTPGYYMYYDTGSGNPSLIFAVSAAPGSDQWGNTWPGGAYFAAASSNAQNVLTVADSSGNTLGGIDSAGNVTGAIVSGNTDVVIAGNSFVNDIQPNLALGLVTRGQAPTTLSFPWPATAIGTTETAIMELDVTIPAYRAYRLTVPPAAFIPTLTVNAQYVQRLRYTTDGSTPSTSSTELAGVSPAITPVASALTGLNYMTPAMTYYPPRPTADTTYKFLLTAYIQSGTFQYHSLLNMVWEDLGNNPTGNQATVFGSGSSGGSSKQNYTKTYPAVHTYAYQGSTGHQPNTLFGTDTYAQQGGDYADTYNGDSYSWILWPYSTIASDLSGATINWVKLKLANQHTWYNSGGTCQVGWDTRTSFPSTTPQPSSLNNQVSQHFNEGQTLTFEVDSNGSTWGAAFQTGGATSTLMAANTSDLLYYMYFSGGTAPQLIINYTK